MNRKIVMGIAFVVILFLTFSVSRFFISKKTLPPQRPLPEVKSYVKVKPVQYENVPVMIESYGRLASSQSLNVVSEVSGRLKIGDVIFKEGQSFKAGQVLVRINKEEQFLTLQSRKSSFINIVASTLPDLKIDLPERYQTWYLFFENINLNNPLPAIPEITSVKERTFFANRGVLSEYYNIRSLEENLKKFDIVAPYSGTVQGVNLEIGAFVTTGSVIGTIIRTDKFELKVPVEIKDIDFVKIGTEVSVKTSAESMKIWKGKVVRKADFLDVNTQSVSVFIEVNNSRNDLYEGQYLKALIPGSIIPDALLIERSILKNKDEVFVVEDSRLISKQVNLLKIMANQVVINGLKSGDLLVVDAPSNASNNMKVEIAK